VKQIWHMLFFVQFLTTRLRYVLNSKSILSRISERRLAGVGSVVQVSGARSRNRV